jgi:integrase
MEGELLETMRFQKELRDARHLDCRWVFFGESGERTKNYRGAWETACTSAKLGHRLFYDFRRTAVRNMVRAGVPERVPGTFTI